jgi:hypothetical protein
VLITQGSVVRVHSGPLRRSEVKAAGTGVTGDGEAQKAVSRRAESQSAEERGCEGTKNAGTLKTE